MTTQPGVVPDDLDGFVDAPDTFTDVPVSELVRHWARTRGDEPAYVSPAGATSWSEYDLAADRVYTALRAVPGEHSLPESVAVYLPDTVGFHVALVGAYRAGIRVAAMGARSGPAEVGTSWPRPAPASWSQRRDCVVSPSMICSPNSGAVTPLPTGC